ncbi:MAG TPA: hypothetical protein VJM32_02310 [Candidatus Saccharimonadales bacterium]|nr:hypothetical protein [Candidatus Saccharimonadales bacterium]
MSREPDADAIAAHKERMRINRIRELWYLALRTLNKFAETEATLTKPRDDERPWPAYYSSTLDYRTTATGVFTALARLGATDVAEGLRLRILNEWGPYSPQGQPITILDHLDDMHRRHRPLVPVPDLDLAEWEALGGLVASGPNPEYVERLTAATELSTSDVESLVAAFQEQPAMRGVMLAH